MIDGFYPIQHLVYDRIRVSLLKLHRALVANGLAVLAVHTDCFVVASTPEFEQFVESEWLPLHKAFGTADKFGGDKTLLKAEQDRLLSLPEIVSAMELPAGLKLTTERRVEDMGLWHKEPKPKTAKFEMRSVRKTPCPELLSFPRTGSLSDITAACDSAVRSTDPFPVWITPEFQGEGFFTNKAYVVEGIVGDTYLVRSAPDEDPVPLSRMFFRRDVAWTAHSVQGETIADDYCIFESTSTSPRGGGSTRRSPAPSISPRSGSMWVPRSLTSTS
jgi:hypothetical protein